MKSVQYHRVAKMTYDEKVEMYMKSTKKELIEMIIECNNQLNLLVSIVKNIDKNNLCNECGVPLESGTVFCSHDCRRHYHS